MELENNGYLFRKRNTYEIDCQSIIKQGSDEYHWIKENAQFPHVVLEVDDEITGEEFILSIPKEDDSSVNNLREAYGSCPVAIWEMLKSASSVAHEQNPDDPGFVLFLLN